MVMAKPKSNTTTSRMFVPDGKWEDKDEFLDIIYWGRQLIAVIIGLIWGYLGLTGSFGIVGYAAINSGIVYIYSGYVNEEPEDAITAVKEGFLTSFASFVVTWTIVYSILHANM